MQRQLTPQQRGEVYARIFRDLTALVPIVAGAPNILGPIYGARMCDRALKVGNAFDRLMIGLEDAMPYAIWDAADKAWKDHSYRSSRPRATLRARAGGQQISEDEIRHTATRFFMPPLSLSEHERLGGDLKAVHAAMSAAACDIGNAGGKRRDDLRRRAAKVERLLLALRSHLDSAVHRQYADEVQWPPLAAIYFGATVASDAAETRAPSVQTDDSLVQL